MKIGLLENFAKKRRLRQERLSNDDGRRIVSFCRQYNIELLIVLLFALLLALLFPKGKSFQFADLKEGSVYTGEEIIAPFTFPINKSPEEYSGDLKRARESVALVFERRKDIAVTQEKNLAAFLNRIYDLLKNPGTKPASISESFSENGIVIADDDIEYLLSGRGEVSDNPGANGASGSYAQRRAAAFKSIALTIQSIVKELFSTGILNIEKADFSYSLVRLSVRQDGQEMIEDANYYHGIKESRDTLLERLRKLPALNEREIKIAYQIGVHFLIPDVIFIKEETDVRIADVIANVPLAKDQVLAGERIIDAHERVTRHHVEKLRSLAEAKAEYGQTMGFWSRLRPGLGKFLISLSIISIFLIFLWRDRRSVINNPKQLLLIALVIFIVAQLTFLVNRLDISAYLIPVALGSMIITIFFDSYLGFLSAISLSLLVGAMRGNEYATAFVSFFVNSIAILTVSRVRKRNWVLRSIVSVACAYIFAISIQDFLSYVSFRAMVTNWGYGILNGFLTPVIAYGLIVILEYAFDLTTDMTLLELSDLNHPLLRELAMEAPGTYHHSIVVGNLAEAATEAVGGNPLLARVGAYYHDIGKMEKPEYFVENQTKGRNPQEKLTPTMSSLILLNHVRRGAEMAREHSLPKEIEAFIYEHHGTSLMSYFYQKAVQHSEGTDISENEFRYPGPRPKSRETAIVMLADAIEAASRTLKDPSPSRIKGMVEQMIDERFKSGELDDSPLTLHDLSKIAEAFQKILIGIFHARIEYPAGKEKVK
jgi:putative nucleotidyltransferase with HDIG domain